MEITTVRDRLAGDERSLSAAAQTPLSVCLLGQPYWAGKLEASLNQFGNGRVESFLPSRSLWRAPGALRKIISADVIVRVGFRPGAHTWRGRAFDILWSVLRLLNSRAARVFYWLGTDVLNTCEDHRAGRLRARDYGQAKTDFHLADAPWLVEELRSIDIQALAKTLTLPALGQSGMPGLPQNFSVLTYIPDGRYQFYGGESVYQAAKRFPQIRFDVVGGKGGWIPESLPNLIFHGWQREMAPFYGNATVLIRLLPHDGTGLTAVEALSLGRHVIYSFPLPHTINVAWGDTEALTCALWKLLDQHERGELNLNTSGQDYVEEHFDHKRRIEELIAYFEEICLERRSARDGH